ncbi:hypothetical protein GIB67_041021 [Kingdonia uniflora]|uniref:Uncharacterized protein n=1 Tax=Kingdonia uniflora TaxID=39325 RepID=A0A7J7NBX8_9MAGN|nr:hypothetical protein GIB67_041021 [Kingdonia uniflora]
MVKEGKGLGSRRREYSSVVRGKLNSTANSHSDTEDLEVEKRDRGIDESISLEYFDGDVQNDLTEGFSKLEYGLSLPLTNLANGVINAIGACPVQMNGNMWEIITNFKASGGSYFCASVTRRYFFDLNSAGRTWNDNIIWVKGNCLQRDDEELLDLRFRSVKQSVKSIVEKKESLLDKVTKEETELELVLGELGLSRKKRVEYRSKKVLKAQFTRSMTGVNERKRQTSGEEFWAKTPGSGSSAQPNLTISKIAQKFMKRLKKKALLASGTTVSYGVAQGKRRVESLGDSGEKVIEGQSTSMDDLKKVEERARLTILQGKEDMSHMLQVKAKANLDEMSEERDRLGRHLMLKGYSQEEVDAIKADTYVEEEEEEAKVLGVLDGLDGVSPQTVLDIQGDDVELPEGGSEKVELDASLTREDHALMCNREFAEQFDRMKEVNENGEDQYVKAYYRLKKLNQAFSDLTRQVNALAVKGKQADMAQYRIQALEHTDELCRYELHRCRINLERMRHKFIGKDDELRVARENLSVSEAAGEYLQTALPAKDMEIREMQRRLKVCYQRLKARFATGIISGLSRSDLLRVIVAYFVEEVKNLESERDTLLKTLSDKGCACGAKIDRGNYLGTMETQLGPRTAESIARGRVAVARELKDRPLDDVEESIADTSAEKNLL